MKAIGRARTLLLAIAALAVIAGGCGEELPTQGSGQAVLRIRIQPPQEAGARLRIPLPEDPGAGGSAGPSQGGDARVAAALFDYDSVRVGALEVLADQTTVLRAQQSVALVDSATRFQVALTVSPASEYHILVEVFGAVGTSGLSGILFSGAALVQGVAAGSQHDVEIPLIGAVPEMTAQALQNGVLLQWSAVSGAARYRVAETVDGETRDFTTAATDTFLEYNLKRGVGLTSPSGGTGALRARQATYRVRAEFTEGAPGAYGAVAMVAIPELIPLSAVDDLAVSSIAATSVTLVWTAPGDDLDAGQASAYDVRTSDFRIDEENFAQASPVPDPPAPASAGSGETFVVSGLLEGQTYYFALKTSDDAGTISALSNVVSATAAGPPDPPVDFTIESTSESELTLRWIDQADDESGYEIERRRIYESLFAPIETLAGAFTGEVSLVDSELAERSRFVYRVRAFNDRGVSAWVTAQGRTRIARPQELGAEAAAYNSVALTWSFEWSAPNGFRIERRTGDATFGLLGDVGPDSRSYADGTVSESTTYTYRIFAYEDSSISLASNEAPVTTPAMPRPLCSVSDTLVDFGTREVFTETGDHVVLRNLGDADLSGTVEAECSAFSITLGGGDYVLTPGDTLEVSVMYAPVAAGTHSCWLSVGEDCPAIRLAGIAQEIPHCSIVPATLDFPETSVGAARDLSVLLASDGTGVLDGSVSADCSHFSVVAGAGVYSLAPGESREVIVRYAPLAAGEHACAIAMGAGCGSLYATGTGILLPECTVTPNPLDFGPVFVGASETGTFTITNTGGGVLAGTVTAEAGYFSVVAGGGDFELVAMESRVVTVLYRPLETGTHTSLIDLGTACAAVTCDGTGDAPDDHWWGGFGGYEILDGWVYDLELLADVLSVGGTFTGALKWWMGAGWTLADYTWPYGNTIDELVVYEGDLVAAGSWVSRDFANADTYVIGRLDFGSGWHIMGTFNGPIRDLCVRDSSLFAAGGFRSGIDGGYEFIAEWTGS
ncbi:MAG: choice-of-anchor D domain-containing protein, partial [Candidatus Eisenbacteria bacterium]